MKTQKKVLAFLMALVILTGLMGVTALADSVEIAWGAATVDTAALNIRSGPSTDYDRVGILAGGTIVVILEKTTKDWYKINYAGTVGYVASEYLTDVLKAENFKATGTVIGNKVRMRKGPSTDKAVITMYSEGDQLSVIGINNGWYKVVTQEGTGYIRSDYIKITGGGPSYTTVKSETTSLGQEIANYALQFVGYKYVYGEESPSRGFDCSGLMYYVYGQFGYKIARGATAQYNGLSTHLKRDELQPGDLVFFSTNGGQTMYHVGMYIGNGQFVHASNSRVGVIISDLDSTHYSQRFYSGARVI